MSRGLRVLCGIVDDVSRSSVNVYWSDRRMVVKNTVRMCLPVVGGDTEVELSELPNGTLIVFGDDAFFRHYDDSYEVDIDADPVWTNADGVLYTGSDLQDVLSGCEAIPLMVSLQA